MIGLQEFFRLLELYWYAWFDKTYFQMKYIPYIFNSYEYFYPWGLVSLFWQENFRGSETLSADEGTDTFEYFFAYDYMGTSYLFAGGAGFWVVLLAAVVMLYVVLFMIKLSGPLFLPNVTHYVSRDDNRFQDYSFGTRVDEAKLVHETLKLGSIYDVASPSRKRTFLAGNIQQEFFADLHSSMRRIADLARSELIGVSQLTSKLARRSKNPKRPMHINQREGINPRAFWPSQLPYEKIRWGMLARHARYAQATPADIVRDVDDYLKGDCKYLKSIKDARKNNPVMLKAIASRVEASVSPIYRRAGAVFPYYRYYYFHPSDHFFVGAYSGISLWLKAEHEPSLEPASYYSGFHIIQPPEPPAMGSGGDLEQHFYADEDFEQEMFEDAQLFPFAEYGSSPSTARVLDYITHAPNSEQPLPIGYYAFMTTRINMGYFEHPFWKDSTEKPLPIWLEADSIEESVVTTELDLDDTYVFRPSDDVPSWGASWETPFLHSRGPLVVGRDDQYAQYSFVDFSQYGSFFSEDPFLFSAYSKSWQVGSLYPLEYESLLYTLVRGVANTNNLLFFDSALLAQSARKLASMALLEGTVFNYSTNDWVQVAAVPDYIGVTSVTLARDLFYLGGNDLKQPGGFPTRKKLGRAFNFISACFFSVANLTSSVLEWFAIRFKFLNNDVYSVFRPGSVIGYLILGVCGLIGSLKFKTARSAFALTFPTKKKLDVEFYNDYPMYPYWLQYGYSDAAHYFDFLDDYEPFSGKYELGIHTRPLLDLVIEPPTNEFAFLKLWEAYNPRQAASIQRDLVARSFVYSSGSLSKNFLIQRAPAAVSVGVKELDESAALLDRRRSARVAFSVVFPHFWDSLDAFLDVPHRAFQKAANRQDFRRDFTLEIDPSKPSREWARKMRNYRRKLLKKHLALYMAGDKSARPGRLERPLMKYADGKPYMDMRHFFHNRWKRMPKPRAKLPPWSHLRLGAHKE